MGKNTILRRARGILRYIGVTELVIASVMLAGILAVILVQVLMRTVFDRPNAWAEEAAVYLFIWITMVGASVASKMQRHITIRTFVSSLPSPAKFFIRLFVYLAMLAAMAVVLLSMPRILRVEMMSTTVAFPVRLPRAWFFSIPLVYSLASISVVTIYYAVALLGDWSSGNEPGPILGSSFLELQAEEEEIP